MPDLNTILAGSAIPPDARVVDQQRIEAAVREILLAVGEDPDRDGLLETPARVARMYAEIFGGLHLEPGRHLKKVFEEQYDEMVLVRDISFNSMCEHHLLPFMGKAHVGYIPRGKVTGLSKLARVVDEVARRPQVQERMTHMIADLIENELAAKGVTSFCLSLDPQADEYVREIFGKRWRVLDRIERLPETLPGLYMELTR